MMGFLNFFKKEKNDMVQPIQENNMNIENVEESEDWGNLLPTLIPISLGFFDSIEMKRLSDDELYIQKYNLRTVPQKGYEI